MPTILYPILTLLSFMCHTDLNKKHSEHLSTCLVLLGWLVSDARWMTQPLLVISLPSKSCGMELKLKLIEEQE